MESIWKNQRWGGLPGIGEPGLRNDKSYIFINNVGENNRRHSSTCREHTWEG